MGQTLAPLSENASLWKPLVNKHDASRFFWYRMFLDVTIVITNKIPKGKEWESRSNT